MTLNENIVNKVPYLKESRNFPEERLDIELNQSYNETAKAINDRTIGLFPVDKPAIGGESWFISKNKKQQNLRQVYTFTTETTIAHGIDFNDISHFTKCHGSFTDGTNNWYGILYGGTAAPSANIIFNIDPTNINIIPGAGAPVISSGIIILEWLSNT